MTIQNEIKSDGETARFEREIRHGQYLAQADTEIKWGWGTPAGQQRMRRRATLIAEAAGLDPQMHVLEVGCGTGLFTERFAATGCRLTAVDLSPDLLSRARERVKNLPNVSFELKPFEDCRGIGPFDAIIGSSVLHHLELRPALRNMRELLKPGGRLAFAEPNHLNPQIFCERKFRRLFPNISPDETAFYRRGIARDLGNAGFADIQVVPFDWLHPATPAALIPLVFGLGRILERLPGIREFSGSLLMSARKPLRETTGLGWPAP